MKKYFLTILAALAISVVLMSWGSTGHHKINTEASLSFNEQMNQFLAWTSTLAEHASDADYRKDTDPTEGPKHYIDIDNYTLFNESGRIPQTYDSVVALYGESWVIDQGILPWATCIAVDTLKACFERHDWDKAVLIAADLGHYVADGHMPLHITKNYDGQYSGNSGIHSRYESTMINAYISQINYTGESIEVIPDVNQYVFDYLYHNYMFVDSVLMADDYAKEQSGGSTYSQVYKQALWDSTRSFTVPLFKDASHALAELMYTAWVEAGSPLINPNSVLSPMKAAGVFLEQNTPNPFSGKTHIRFSLTHNSKVLLQVRDMEGMLVDTLFAGDKNMGSYSIDWAPQNLAPGMYYLVLNTGKAIAVKKMILMK